MAHASPESDVEGFSNSGILGERPSRREVPNDFTYYTCALIVRGRLQTLH